MVDQHTPADTDALGDRVDAGIQRARLNGHLQTLFDQLSDLIAAHEAGETLSAQELVDFCIVLLVGGNETTTNLLGNAVLCFDDYPEAFAQLKQDSQLPGKSELMRTFVPNH